MAVTAVLVFLAGLLCGLALAAGLFVRSLKLWLRRAYDDGFDDGVRLANPLAATAVRPARGEE